MSLFLFYLLLFLLPTQLGRHFFFDFSLIGGLRSDYLTPTVYLTDVIAALLLGVWWLEKKRQNIPRSLFLLSVIGYLLFTSIFIASNQWAALYKLVKIVEFILLGWVIVRIRPNLLTVLTVLSFSVFYSSLIAFGQFATQKSIGGLFWFLGERSFYAGTPGIALVSLGGKLLLRPYATFPHPNVFGGFLALVLPLLFYILLADKRINKFLYGWFFISFVVGFMGLFLSFSRAAWLVGVFGFLLVILIVFGKERLVGWKRCILKKSFLLILFYGLLFTSIMVSFFLARLTFFREQSWQERKSLIEVAISIVSSNPVFGVGLNNSIAQQWRFLPYVAELYVFQPVHNVYLLILAETGLIGFLILTTFLSIVFFKSLKKHITATIAVVLLIILGFFDHYLFTLQQGQLLFTLFASLAFIPRNKVN